jgi:hypothetical protein
MPGTDARNPMHLYWAAIDDLIIKQDLCPSTVGTALRAFVFFKLRVW